MRSLFLVIVGGSYGLLSAAGVFTVFVTVGLIPRFAGKTHTARYVVLYEELVVFGTFAGCFATVFSRYCGFGAFLQQSFPERLQLWYALGMVLQLVFGLFCGLPCTCHCGDAGQYSDFCQENLIPARSGACHIMRGNRKALRLPVIFLPGAAQSGNHPWLQMKYSENDSYSCQKRPATAGRSFLTRGKPCRIIDSHGFCGTIDNNRSHQGW